MTSGLELLTVEEMGRADGLTIGSGVPGIVLMDNAGRSIAREIVERWPTQPVLVICGPGNNGGDGFVVAGLAAQQGVPATVLQVSDPGKIQGDALAARPTAFMAMALNTYGSMAPMRRPARMSGSPISTRLRSENGLVRVTSVKSTSFSLWK